MQNKNLSTKEDKQILFLHGYLSSGICFYNQLSYFSRDFEVFAPDLKGFGENADMPYPYSLDDYIDQVAEFSYKHGLVKPHVIAHSFGGRITIKGVATKKLDFNKIVFTGCAGLKPKNTLKKRAKKLCFNIAKRFVKKEKLTRFYSSDYLSLNGVMKQSFVKIVNEHLDGYLPYINNQTLIINGDLDRETPLYMAKKLNRNILHSRLLVFKGCSHFCFLDKPNKFNMEVKEFILS